MNSTRTATVVEVTAWRGGMSPATRMLPEETAVVLTYDRVSFAVMMASPADLEDFALGFSLSEGIIESPADIISLEIVALPDGIECRMSLTPLRRDALEARRRHIAGPAGCGLCGIDRLAEAVRIGHQPGLDHQPAGTCQQRQGQACPAQREHVLLAA